MSENLETQQWSQNWKRSILIPISKKGSTKECSNHQTTALISHASKVMLKHCVNQELPDVQTGFRKRRGAKDQIVNICWITEKAREFQNKNILLFHWLKSLTVWIITDSVKEMEIPDHLLPVSWKTCMRVKKQQWELCMEWPTASGLQEYDKAVYCHLVYSA